MYFMPYALIIYIYMKVKLLVLKTEDLMSDKNCQTVKLGTPWHTAGKKINTWKSGDLTIASLPGALNPEVSKYRYEP